MTALKPSKNLYGIAAFTLPRKPASLREASEALQSDSQLLPALSCAIRTEPNAPASRDRQPESPDCRTAPEGCP